MIIISSFKVPAKDQQKVLLFGIVFALIARSGLIFVGAALINTFAWVFYLFGLILLLTAGNMLRGHDDGDEDKANNFVIRIAKKVLHTTDYYDEDRMFTIVNGKRAMTPMLLVMVAIGGTDLLFALDSIPAIFGLTQSVFVVFTATAFSLMGLRQLYFLLDGLLDRLIYLSYGLAAILGLIGVKLILHALHENNLPFVNEGEPVNVVKISTQVSLSLILGILVVTIVASLVSPKGKALTALKNAHRYADHYLDLDYESDPRFREITYAKLVRASATLRLLPDKYRGLIREEKHLLEKMEQAKLTHEEATAGDAGARRYPA
jgi:tellurite resistance protein TerC